MSVGDRTSEQALTSMASVLSDGWHVAKVTADDAETIEIYEGTCLLGGIFVETPDISVTPKDDTDEVWAGMTSLLGLHNFFHPIAITTSLQLSFSAAGSAWVIWK